MTVHHAHVATPCAFCRGVRVMGWYGGGPIFCPECVPVERSAAESLALAWREQYTARLSLQHKLDMVASLLEINGCDCECEHHPEEHDDDCALCLACRVGAAIGPRSSW